MKYSDGCSEANARAGAIALGEADEREREAYRRHLAACGRCVGELGGERDIERVMAVVAAARDEERWEPQLRVSLLRPRARNGWAYVVAVAAVLVAAIGLRAAEMAHPPSVARTVSPAEVRAIAALGTETSPRREGRAESLRVAGASAASASLAVTLDDRGRPLRCTILKSSGDAAVDRSICAATMRAHYPHRRR